MMKNRAGLLALAVLVSAILLMVLFVMPRISGDASKVGDAINQASTDLKNTVNEAAKTSRSPAAVADQLGRLTADAGVALGELKALFADGKGPAVEVFTAAKTKTINALTALAGFTIPEGVDPATQAAATKAKEGGAKALAIVQSLPENITDALAAIARAEAALTGAPEPAAAAANAGPKLPAFDVLRVEPDGSTVIAGSAEPNGKLEVLDGEKVVTTADVGPSGDFAAVLDNPLPAGDHQLVLKVTDKDGNTTLSEEVATVSVPKDGNGANLLAMVSKPGTASRIITAPTGGTEVADASNPALPADKPAAGDAPAGTAAPTGELALQTPGLPDASAGGADTAAAVPGAAQADKATAPDVMVNAVEIEGNKIFIAGTARANAKVLGYADDNLVGQDTAGADGHFIIDGVMALSVGDHKIRVDVVDPTGKVIVRAAVNFNRPTGDQVRVAAQVGPADRNGASSMVPLDEGELGKLKAEAGKAFGLLKGLFADGKLPSAEQLAAARSATEFALRSLVDFRPAADASDPLKQASGAASETASNALKILQVLPQDAKSVGAALDRLGALIAELTAAPAPAAPASTAPAANEAAGNQPKTIEQAPLTADNAAVIIRRGDTLWQISRRTYGLGVRYTTIYIANEDKIIDPDRIRPGQIFGLPKDALPNAEELHRKRLSNRHL
ncbi:LysM peptidoglycan-binding domain-containing protein [Rhizobium sp. MC63]|uniref:LysM peptidoglycan-binding domain-containing protein n=1 Tax=Rhizobium mulingense TaxID=3031128 RepID=A0ACC6N0N9_9HYPH|nr:MULTISPECIES: LysM peptidoglycan-binding domain-containing protein [unclassified Rhizobium]MDF0699145.1 LysM peptidoglycan-binding domain-containing protein [Rhizobium sp. MC63]MEA3519205.1 LysM peptidoglycan-binding domain-containing protein [Rhizobium sp. MJ31]MEB3047250.1 LysM peptidoglycan-binding domain-containing protein [Rhizobium sp. MJ21]